MLRRIRSDERGVAAVEFALIAPIMILLYCGLAELSIAMMAERRAAHAASVVGDLVAQSGQMSTTDLSDIYKVANSIMYPFPTATLKLRVTSVTADVNAAAKVSWSQANGMTAFGKNTTVAGFPAGLLVAGDSVIQSDVQYTFTSPLRYVLPNPMPFSNTYILKPRNGGAVACATC
ncbi:TadE/TadG family type IV pilus assembly protein [Phenylobacterium sp.]|uniref:TadE/TadG family type IV pilus assembly protein n=1 Tax=Phenylobacterium sp. TaxID=1871053 RepID=UPI003565C031